MPTPLDNPTAKKKHRFLRILGKTALVLLILFVALVLFIRSPWGQGIIVQKAVSWASEKTGTTITLERLFITFAGDVSLEGLYIEDLSGDTLVFSRALQVDAPLMSIILGKGIGVEEVHWEGFRANVIRQDTVKGFNFDFLIDAFSADSIQSTEVDTATAEPLDIVLGQLDFTDFDLTYKDDVLGIDSRLILGELAIDVETFDLQGMIFEVDDASLSDVNGHYVQTKPFESEESENTGTLPQISVGELTLENISAHYHSEPDGLLAKVDLGRLHTENPIVDLEPSHYQVDEFMLSDSRFDVQVTSSADVAGKATPADSSFNFNWPQLVLELGDLKLENNSVNYSVDGANPVLGTFNPNAIQLSAFTFIADEVLLKDNQARLELGALTLAEGSGINLKELGFDLEITETEADLSGLSFALGKSSFTGSVAAEYPSIQGFIDEPERVHIDLLLDDLDLHLADAFPFNEGLKENKPLLALSQKPVTGRVQLEGTLAQLQFSDDRLLWGESTELSFEGRLEYPTEPERLAFEFPNISLHTTRGDAIRFLAEDSVGIRLPEALALNLSAVGTLEKSSGNVILKTSFGDATVKGQFDRTETIAFEIDASVKEFQVGRLLLDERFGALSLQVQSNGNGDDIGSLNAELEAVVEQFQINGYAITNLQLQGEMTDGSGTIASRYKDENLNATLDGTVVLDSIASEFGIDLDVIGMDMQALGITDKPIRAALQLEANIKGDMENFDLTAQVDNSTFVYDQDAYRLGLLDLKAHVAPDTTSATIKNELIDLDLQSNTDPATFSAAMARHLRSYFVDDSTSTDTLVSPVKLKLKGKVSQAPILSEVFVNKLRDLDTIQISVEFDEQKRLLNAAITAPHIDYDGYLVDSLQFTLDTQPEDFTFDLGFAKVEADPVLLKRTTISGKEAQGRLDLVLNSYDGEEQLIYMRSELSGEGEMLRYHVDPEGLTFSKKAWTIAEENALLFGKDKIAFDAFRLSRNAQSVELTDKVAKVEQEHLALLFENFQLGDFLSYFNPDEELAKGSLQGELIIVEPFGNAGLLADLDITEFHALNVHLGRLTLDATSEQFSAYDFSLALKDGSIDLDLNGEFQASSSSPALDLDLDLHRFDIAALENFMAEDIAEAKGSLNGRFTVKGHLGDPQYDGSVRFDQAGFKVVKLNTSFSLQNEELAVNNKALSMNGFTVLDDNGNAFKLSGKVLTEDIRDPQFDLKVNAKGFQVLNATKEDNDLIYGKAIFDLEGSVKGDLDIPKLDVTLHVDPRTDLTYVLPSAVAQIEERDGVVTFVNRKDPDAILTRTEEVSANLSGFDVKALIKVGKKAKVTMVLNEDTGDNFKVSGEGNLRFGMEPNGRMTLAGVYDVSSGSYELNLYGLVKRRFELSPDSKVSWSGDPMDAKLDIRAIYRQEASSSPLMASVTSGMDPSAKSRYRQVLPFLVYLDIAGTLDAPEISFELDMPEDEQGAIGGQVYGRIQQVNNQEEELNKQVFSLLVLNRFYPESGSDGSSGGLASVARDNLNDAVSDQLNAFSDKLLGRTGVQLEFGLDSYTDYQGETPTERTQLEVAAKKKLFNDRLIVSVGSEVDIQGSSPTEETTPLIGKVSIEYVLTPNGRYRLKGFRRNEYENMIDGQTIVSGFALIFTQEFNEFHELWQAIFKKQLKEEGTEEE